MMMSMEDYLVVSITIADIWAARSRPLSEVGFAAAYFDCPVLAPAIGDE